MQTMNVDIPDSLNEYVQQQVVERGYGSVSDYLCDLVQADQLRKEKQTMEAKVIQAIECNEFIPLTDEVWNQMRETLNERLKAKQEIQA